MPTDWDDTDTIAEIERDTGEHVIHVDLGKRARIRYWARSTGRCHARTADCPLRCSDHAAGVVCPRLVGVMPSTDWSPL